MFSFWVSLKIPFCGTQSGARFGFLSHPLSSVNFFVPAYVVPFLGAQLGSYTYTPSRFFLCVQKKKEDFVHSSAPIPPPLVAPWVSLFSILGVRSVLAFPKQKWSLVPFFLSSLYPLADKSSCTLSTQSHLHPHWSPSNSGFSMLLDCILASTILSHKSRCAIDFGTIAGLSVFGGLLRLFSPSVMGFWSELGHPFCPSTYKNAVCERPPQKQHLFLVSYLNAHWTLHPLQHAFYSCHSPPTP